MKLPLTATALALLTAGFARAQNSVTLEWNKNPEPDISGYRIYQKVITPAPIPPAGTPTQATPAPPVVTWKLVGTAPASPTPTHTVQGLPAGSVATWTVTAFSPSGESGRSNEASASILSVPGNFRVKVITAAP